MELQLSHLTKIYPNGVRALDDVSLTIPPGLFGLLGPNGAGKSTLMRIVATLQEPDQGSVTFGEIDVRRQKDAMRRLLGYLPQEFGFYPSLSAEATLEHFAELKGIAGARQRRELAGWLLHQTNLYEARQKRVGGFSGGMRQRLGIAVALLGRPRILIVDEPTAGLDPAERNRFLNLLSAVGENIVVILSTHIVEDVRELCTQMAILSHGRVVTEGSPADVLSAVEGRIWRRVLEKHELAEAQASYQIVSTRLVAGNPVINVYSDEPPGDGFEPVEADLADAYFFQVSGGARARSAAPPRFELPPAETPQVRDEPPGAADDGGVGSGTLP